MGKQSKSKQERKVKCKQIDEWAKPPDDALYGKCPDSTCPFPRCLDPFVTHDQFASDQDLSVILTYTTPDFDHMVRVNGEDIGVVDSSGIGEVVEVLSEKYGNDVGMALVEHMLRRIEMMRGTLLN